VDDPETVFSQIEHSLRQAIIDAGGSISHHHGVGKLRKDFMKHTLSSPGIRLLKQVKQATDPHNIFGIGNNVLGE
jgi:alkyldihydroxyacetonephosphate synthase